MNERYPLAVELMLRDGRQVLHESLEILHFPMQPLRGPGGGEGLQLLGTLSYATATTCKKLE